MRRGRTELFLVEEEYRLSLLTAETAFVEEFIGKITDPDAGWDASWAQFHGESGPLAQGNGESKPLAQEEI